MLLNLVSGVSIFWREKKNVWGYQPVSFRVKNMKRGRVKGGKCKRKMKKGERGKKKEERGIKMRKGKVRGLNKCKIGKN
jgi:hypothetical protein